MPGLGPMSEMGPEAEVLASQSDVSFGSYSKHCSTDREGRAYRRAFQFRLQAMPVIHPLIVPDGQITEWLSSPLGKNIWLRRRPKSAIYRSPSRPTEGRSRDRHGRGMRWTLMAQDDRRCCGRRSRVVLTPRRWSQAGGVISAGDGGKRARSPGRARRKPLKPLRGESRLIWLYLW
jgi:hypothetical protein